MDTIKIFDRKNTKIIAHRGGSLELENTIGAFISSANRSFFGIETDIYKTADGRFIIYHDETTARLCFKTVTPEEESFETLRGLEFRPYKGRISRQDIKMPSLEEYIDICKSYNKVCVLEIKHSLTEEDIKELLNIVNGFEYLDNFIFISFYVENLIAIKELCPTANVQFLIDATESTLDKKLSSVNFPPILEEGDTGVIRLLKFLKNHHIDLDVWDQSVDQALIDTCHQMGIKVNVFTVNTPEDAQKFIDMGADFITTDCLE